MVIGDMKAKVGESEGEGILRKFGVRRMNENGRILTELCMKMR